MYGGHKKNLIYICVFHQENYIELLKLLIKSISLRSNINKDTTDILIITSPAFLPIIQKELSEYDLPLQYMTLNLNTKMEAGCCKLNIFDYEKISLYNKILYLDTDVLINSDINILFNLEISSDKIYALEEGEIGHEYWGKQFFDFKKFDPNTKAFSSGVFYLMNNEKIKTLLSNTKTHIDTYINKDNNPEPVTLDQPFIVYNAFIENKYDNQLMKQYMENNPTEVSKDKIIYHFPGGPGNYSSKIEKMNNFFDKMIKNNTTKTHIGGSSIDFTFGITTGGDVDERIQTICESIRKEKIPNYEIIIVGDSKVIGPDVRIIPFDESVETYEYMGKKHPPHAKKKNLIMKEAKYENVILLHDYISLKEGWYNGFLKFGNNFEVCMCPIVNTFEGTKSTNYFLNMFKHPDFLSLIGGDSDARRLPRDFKLTPLLSKLTYPEGKFQIYKKKTGLRFPLYEGYGVEDTMMGVELANTNIMIHINKESEILFLKPHNHLQKSEISNENLDKLYNLSESKIMEILQKGIINL